MSIVYDYLKQVQKKREADVKPVPASPSSRPAPASPARFSWRMILGIFLVLVLAGTIIYLVGTRRGEKTVVKLYQSPSSRAAYDSGTAAKSSGSDVAYVLEGIIYNPSSPFAIINGKTVERNARLGDYEVVAITPSSVTLKNTQDNVSRTLQL